MELPRVLETVGLLEALLELAGGEPVESVFVVNEAGLLELVENATVVVVVEVRVEASGSVVEFGLAVTVTVVSLRVLGVKVTTLIC